MTTRIHEPVIAEGVLRPTHVAVDLDRLADNYRAIQSHVGQQTGMMAVLKANAYGHGLVPVAKLYEQLGARYLGLAFLEEAIRLRQEGIRCPILVLGGILGSQIPRFLEHDLTLTASSVDKLRAIDACAASLGRRAKVHLKVDTGMERIGVHYYSADALLEASLTCRNVVVEGIFTHFANSDAEDVGYTRLQLERFEEVLRFYEDRSLPLPIRHAANSAAVARLPESWFDMVRPGLLLYGVYPSPSVPRTIPVRGALTWSSRVVYFKVVKPGHPVSYGSTWSTDRLTRVVTVPVGYGDGYMRSMSGAAEVVIRGVRYPTVGRICMDAVMVDIGQGTAYNGDEVLLLGDRDEACITVEELAAWGGTIPYEILTNINTRVPRTYRGGLPR